MCGDSDGRVIKRLQQRIACPNMLSGAVVRDAHVVMQQRSVEPLFPGLAVAQQSGPIEVLAKQPVAIGEVLFSC